MAGNSEKSRLDSLLVERGLCESRERAQRAIMAGRVYINGQRADKAGTKVAMDAAVEVKGSERYVGRGGLKLERALNAFRIDPAGKVCLDIGASTGGFTDCLLQRGAVRVHALDVGRGQLHWKLRQDPRVLVQEGINCRNLRPEDVGEQVALCVADVSFISLTLILPPAFELLLPEADMVVLIKPQFELAREDVGKGGIVSDPRLHERAVAKIRAFVEDSPRRRWCGVIESPIRGTSGNIEFLAHLRP
jgi:23S rRNA (cytidine1920-2'-O)/16S rRNA (cytidine1409-2'-O)-methyltransferase